MIVRSLRFNFPVLTKFVCFALAGNFPFWFKFKINRLQTKRKQQHIFDTLDALKIKYETVDVAASDAVKEFLKENSPEAITLPQLWVGPHFRSLYEAFENAIEEGEVKKFLATQQ